MQSFFEISNDELTAGEMLKNNAEQCGDLFQTHGAIWLKNVFPKEFVESLAAEYSANYSSKTATELRRNHAVVGDDRFMITVPIQGAFNSPQLYANSILLPILQRLLGFQCRISSFGSVMTLPGAEPQAIHVDFPPLFESESDCIAIPPYAITVVVPLVDIETSTGSTAIWEGTHREIGARKKLHELMANPTFDGAAVPLPTMGDAYLMDYRVIHGGMANGSDSPRPILYFVYGRPWFQDAYNFTDQSPIIFGKGEFKKVPKPLRGMFPNVKKKKK